jgi:hypothetical protein
LGWRCSGDRDFNPVERPVWWTVWAGIDQLHGLARADRLGVHGFDRNESPIEVGRPFELITEVLPCRVETAERDEQLRLLVEQRALLLHGRAEPVHSRLAVRAPSSPLLLCERGQAQNRCYTDNDCLVHGHVPFLFTEASVPLTSQERNRA